MVEFERDLWKSSGPTILLKQGCLEPAAQDHIQTAFKYLHAQPPWAICASAQSPSQWENVSWYSDGTSCVSICAHCLWSCHCSSLRRVWLHPVCALTSGIYVYQQDLPLPQAFSSAG